PTDCEAKLALRHDDLDAAILLIENDLRHFGRSQRVDHERGWIVGPGNDVDLFALQFANDRLHATTAHTHSVADRIDAAVVGNPGDVGAAAGVAVHGLDPNDAVIDSRNFLRKQLGHDIGVGAR